MQVKKVPLHGLEVGMVIADDLLLFDESGRELLAKGIQLTPSLLSRMKTMFRDMPDLRVSVQEGSEPLAHKEQTQNLVKASAVLETTMTALKRGEMVELTAMESALVPIVSSRISSRSLWKVIELTFEEHRLVYNHGVAVAALAALIAHWQGLPSQAVADVGLVGFLHDVGKVATTDHNHPREGVRLLQKHAKAPPSILRAILQHHERNDGSGFPHGSKASHIDTYAKIVAVSDAFHNKVCRTTHRGKCFLLPVAEELLATAPEHLDRLSVVALIDSLSNYYQGRDILLTNSEPGTIVHIDRKKPSQPIVTTSVGVIDCSETSQIAVVCVL